jgi:hypothetical protein
MSVTGSYTWSKSIDTTSGIRNQGLDTLFPQDNRCLRCERAVSSFDTPHRLVFGVVYDLPIGKGRRFNINNPIADTVIGGWQLSGGLALQSGNPQTLTIGGVDNASTGNQGTDRPMYTGVGNGYAANRTTSRWYDPASFAEAPAGAFGNLGRNTMRTPHLQSIDLAVHKQFRTPYNENHLVQFRVEAFNVFNHPSWGSPSGNVLAGAAFAGAPATAARQGFGVISTTAIPMRQLQMGLKYLF